MHTCTRTHTVPVEWHEVEGTKLNLIQDAIKMALDVLVIRLHYLLGIWRVRERERDA